MDLRRPPEVSGEEKLRGADIVARSLARLGCDRVFTLSGNHIMAVFDAAIEAKLDLVHVRHEAAAVHMADAWGRLTGQAGIALVTGGPGHANAIGALYTALGAESPMVLLSGHAATWELGRGGFQEIRQADMAEPVSKASFTAASAAMLGRDIGEAIRIATFGRPGAVHLSLPSDLLEERVESNAIVWPDARASAAPALTDAVADATLAAIAAAARPIIFAGPQLSNVSGRALLARLEAAIQTPAVILESPRGIADATLGAFSDLVRRAAETLIARAAATKPRGGGWLAEARAGLDDRPAAWASIVSQTPGRLHPAQVFRALRPYVERDPATVLICDGGEFAQWGQSMLPVRRRLINGVAGSIGGSLSFACAARLAEPKAPVFVVLGDGTIGFHLSEFETAVRRKLPFIAVLGNDALWNAESQIQLREYGRDRMHGCELTPARYDLVVAALGGHGEYVERAEDLSGAIERALASGKPACINVMIESIGAPVIRAG